MGFSSFLGIGLLISTLAIYLKINKKDYLEEIKKFSN